MFDCKNIRGMPYIGPSVIPRSGQEHKPDVLTKGNERKKATQCIYYYLCLTCIHIIHKQIKLCSVTF